VGKSIFFLLRNTDNSCGGTLLLYCYKIYKEVRTLEEEGEEMALSRSDRIKLVK